MRFIHTADWHLGRPFHSVPGDDARHRLRQARFQAVTRIGEVAREHRAGCVVVGGDLFDSPTPSRETVAEACSVIGKIGLPVHTITGNHDHGGPAGLWRTDHFQRERDRLAPNLIVHESAGPVILDDIVLLACPLTRRHEAQDPSAWIRTLPFDDLPPDRPRVVLAHGSTTTFSGRVDPNDPLEGTQNLIGLDRLPSDELDYVALGDWHGVRQVSPKAWYSGTPERDRYGKGDSYISGQVLLAQVARGAPPQVSLVPTASFQWTEVELVASGGEDGFGLLTRDVAALTQDRVREDLLRLRISGVLGLEERRSLDRGLADLGSRLLRLDLDLTDLRIRPTEEELSGLATRTSDPLIARVAEQLLARRNGEGEGVLDPAGALAIQYLHTIVGEEV